MRLNEYEPLTAAWQAWNEFYEAVDLYGDPVLIRLSALVDVAYASATGLAAYDVDQDELRAYNTAHGED